MSTDKIIEGKSSGLLALHERPQRPPVPILLPRRTRRAIARATGRPFVPVPSYIGQGQCLAWIHGIRRSWSAPADAGFAKSGGES